MSKFGPEVAQTHVPLSLLRCTPPVRLNAAMDAACPVRGHRAWPPRALHLATRLCLSESMWRGRAVHGRSSIAQSSPSLSASPSYSRLSSRPRHGRAGRAPAAAVAPSAPSHCCSATCTSDSTTLSTHSRSPRFARSTRSAERRRHDRRPSFEPPPRFLFSGLRPPE
jgi:hypothetical protein